MEGDIPSTVMCAVVAMDTSNFCYRVCALCEGTVSDNNLCRSCSGLPGSKRSYRILLSVAWETKVFVVVCFDRVARVLFGCSADEFFDLAKLNPLAVVTAGKVLEGEMFQMTFTKPKKGNAEHLRVASIVPLSTDFCPIAESLKEIYRVGSSSSIR
ncbi:Replication factor-a carboxy-terminal domain protein [Thalictrum thalictroides]|uniref:Replication factor-a carboxy-terminal domain protein n=1 Tax=Thalictrum thalictroides TaxID=46969 RepID=A0A7J6X7V0_THATH|nr:Replication factor-a carboxy-terminal domain protein [Thalictrum thalictroides]